MNIVEMLRQALKQQDLTKNPDYLAIVDYLGLHEDEDPEFIREAIETELEELEALHADDLPDAEEDLDASGPRGL
jgi:hypothetical protein